jgi:hypothetical protein
LGEIDTPDIGLLKSHMSKRTLKRPVLGDVVEIPLTKGFAYAQYIFNFKEPPRWGALIRVLTGTFDSRPKDLAKLVAQPERFVVFFPLGAAVNRSIVHIVARFDVPERFQQLPLFKVAGPIVQYTGEVKNWWLWDGTKEWREDPLAVEHYDLPSKCIVTDVTLIEWIESSWHPRDEVFIGRPDLREEYETWKRSQ